jgi:hypothetical protein
VTNAVFNREPMKPRLAELAQAGVFIGTASRKYPGWFGRLYERDRYVWRGRYAVEIRNASFLQPDSFATLARHGVTEVFNRWEAMPPLAEQLAIPNDMTNPKCGAMRLLLRPGRRYEDAVKLFSPSDRLKEPQPESRAAAGLMRTTQRTRQPKRLFVYANKRFEGNALGTIAAIIEKTSE